MCQMGAVGSHVQNGCSRITWGGSQSPMGYNGWACDGPTPTVSICRRLVDYTVKASLPLCECRLTVVLLTNIV